LNGAREKGNKGDERGRGKECGAFLSVGIFLVLTRKKTLNKGREKKKTGAVQTALRVWFPWSTYAFKKSRNRKKEEEKEKAGVRPRFPSIAPGGGNREKGRTQEKKVCTDIMPDFEEKGKKDDWKGRERKEGGSVPGSCHLMN